MLYLEGLMLWDLQMKYIIHDELVMFMVQQGGRVGQDQCIPEWCSERHKVDQSTSQSSTVECECL